MSASVACGYCKGTGKRELQPFATRILDAMSVDEWRTCNEIRERAHMTSHEMGTMNGRLRELRACGLVERSAEPQGRQWLWRKANV